MKSFRNTKRQLQETPPVVIFYSRRRILSYKLRAWLLLNVAFTLHPLCKRQSVPSVALKHIESILSWFKKYSALNRIIASAHCWRSLSPTGISSTAKCVDWLSLNLPLNKYIPGSCFRGMFRSHIPKEFPPQLSVYIPVESEFRRSFYNWKKLPKGQWIVHLYLMCFCCSL